MADPTPAPTPAPADPAPAPTPAPAAWYDGKVDQETLGHWKNKGWDVNDPVKVATEATKAHREAERFIGAPADQILRMPKDAADEAGWNAVWGRLGKPAEAKDYDLSTVKRADGKELDAALADSIRNAAFAANLPKEAATRMAADFVKHLDGVAAASAADHEAKIVEAQAALKKNWGPNFDANMFIAKQAAQKLGVQPAEVDALEKVVGYDRVMEMFRSLGTKMGEDKFVANPGGGDNKVMSRDQAVARKAELMNDAAWTKRYMEGGTAENREMLALNTLIIAAE